MGSQETIVWLGPLGDRGGYGTVVGAPDALKLWDTIGANYTRVCKK